MEAAARPSEVRRRRRFKLAGRDVGRRMRVSVTASNSAGLQTGISRSDRCGRARAEQARRRFASARVGHGTGGFSPDRRAGRLEGNSRIALSYAWLRCNAGGASCKRIVGATGRSFVLRSSDVNSSIRSKCAPQSSWPIGGQVEGDGGRTGEAGSRELRRWRRGRLRTRRRLRLLRLLRRLRRLRRLRHRLIPKPPLKPRRSRAMLVTSWTGD